MVDERESTSTSFDDLPARLLQHRALFLEEMRGYVPSFTAFAHAWVVRFSTVKISYRTSWCRRFTSFRPSRT